MTLQSPNVGSRTGQRYPTRIFFLLWDNHPGCPGVDLSPMLCHKGEADPCPLVIVVANQALTKIGLN